MSPRFSPSLPIAFAFITLLTAAAPPAPVPLRLSAADLDREVTPLHDGLAVYALPTHPGTVLLLGRRDRDGEAEQHATRDDEIIVRQGHASITVGGTLTGYREVSPGEWRGGQLAGGQTFPLAPGDVLWIPAGVPHQMHVPAHGQITYLTLKI